MLVEFVVGFVVEVGGELFCLGGGDVVDFGAWDFVFEVFFGRAEERFDEPDVWVPQRVVGDEFGGVAVNGVEGAGVGAGGDGEIDCVVVLYDGARICALKQFGLDGSRVEVCLV